MVNWEKMQKNKTDFKIVSLFFSQTGKISFHFINSAARVDNIL